MVTHRTFLCWWIAGLVAFAITHYLHTPLAIAAVPGGIGAHQAARTGAEVDAIQQAWIAAGLWPQARIAMSSDLVFITVYSFGALLGGLYFRQSATASLRLIGTLVAVAAVVFALSDYGETIAELVQLLRRQGGDGLAAFASTMRPIKIAAWIATFLGLIVALAIRGWNGRSA